MATPKSTELERANALLRTILSAVNEGITAHDTSGQLLFANDAAARISGFSSGDEMVAATPGAIVARYDIYDKLGQPFPPNDLPGRRILRGEPAPETLVRSRNRDTGETLWSWLTATAVLDEHGKPAIAVNVFRDVTKQRMAEQDWRFLMHAGAALASSLDYETTLAKVASLAVPEVADWCGVEIGEAGSETEQVAVAHVDPAKVELARELRRRWPPRVDDPTNGTQRVLRTGQPELWAEVPAELLEAAARDAEHLALIRQLGLRSAIVAPLIVRGKPRGVVTFVSSQSGRIYGDHELALAIEIARRASIAIENALLFREAQEAIKLRESFMAVAAHELRTPLQVLALTAQALEASAAKATAPLEPKSIATKAARISVYAGRLGKLVERLLDVPRISSGQLALEREPLDLAAMVRDIAQAHAEMAAKAGCSLSIDADTPVLGNWDRFRIESAIINLLANAIKYGAAGAIEVRVAQQDETAVISVADHGIGFEPRDADRLFGRFERLVSGQNYSGLGLGLWIVREIVKAHGGVVTAHSDGPGKGARFEVRLPLGGEG